MQDVEGNPITEHGTPVTAATESTLFNGNSSLAATNTMVNGNASVNTGRQTLATKSEYVTSNSRTVRIRIIGAQRIYGIVVPRTTPLRPSAGVNARDIPRFSAATTPPYTTSGFVLPGLRLTLALLLQCCSP